MIIYNDRKDTVKWFQKHSFKLSIVYNLDLLKIKGVQK